MSFLRTPRILMIQFFTYMSLWMMNPVFNDFRKQALALPNLAFYEIIWYTIMIPAIWIIITIVFLVIINFTIKTPSEFDYDDFVGNESISNDESEDF